MEPTSRKSEPTARLDDAALDGIAAALAGIYTALYDGRPVDPRASVTGNMVAFVFSGGLTAADERLLGADGGGDRLRTFRDQFFEVARADLDDVVADLTEIAVSSSFHGFDPSTRTTHVIFVLDLTGMRDADQREALRNWGEQVRRNGRRLRQDNLRAREKSAALRDEVARLREQLSGSGTAEDGRSRDSDER